MLATASAGGLLANVPAQTALARHAETARAAPARAAAPGATFVLVHGGWHGGWCWSKVTPLLQAAGHIVYTPTLTGLGERAHLLSPMIDLEWHIRLPVVRAARTN